MDKDVQGFSIAFLMIFVSNHNTIVSQETREILSPLSLHYICDLLFLSLTAQVDQARNMSIGIVA